MKENFQTKLNELLSKEGFCIAILFLFTFSLMSSVIIFLGSPFGTDFPQHFQFALTYFEAFKAGNFVPGWSAFENYGYGGIGIRVYPPLAHCFLALTQFITGDWFTSIGINFIFWMFLGSLGIYLLAKEWLSPKNSLFVGILYAFAPYHLAQVFKDFLYSEFIAAAIMPFCFLYLKKVCQKNDLKYVLGLALSVSLLVLSHIPTTIMGIISFAIFTLILLDWKKFWSVFARLLLAGMITVISTSFYWLKVVTEIGLVNHSSPKYTTGYYTYSRHFFPRLDHTLEWYFARIMWLEDTIALVTLLFILPLIIFLVWRTVKPKFDSSISKDYLAIAVTGSFAFFMASSLSSFVWANLQFIQKIQFPFRWLSIATIFGCLMFVIAISQISSQNLSLKKLKHYTLIIFFFGLFLFNVTQVIIPSEVLTREAFEEKLDGLIEKESYDCWWTIWSKEEAFKINEKISANSREFSIIKWESEEREFEVFAGTPTNARIATFYYPHWHATVNGEQVKIERNDDGTISIPLSAEHSKVSLSFVEPFLLKTAKIVSFASFLILLLLFGLSFRKTAG